MNHHSWLPLVLLIGTTASVFAQPERYGPPEPMPGWQGPDFLPHEFPSAESGLPAGALTAHPADKASAVVQAGLDKLLNYLAQEQSLSDQRPIAAFLDREIAPYFDFEAMARWAAGPAYRGMTADEQKALAAQLESDFLATMATNLAGYQGQQVRLLPPRLGPRGTVNVQVAILRPGNYPTSLQFRLAPSGDTWKVYDVVAEGQSAVAYYRIQFQRMAAQVR